MLRRKPTAITITSEDVAAFEEAYVRRLAYAKYLKTGEDPDGLFRNGRQPEARNADEDTQMMSEAGGPGGVAIDPNDELKPLPGDKARIVRSREERIMGAGTAR
ncbi:hypothetical protein A1O1_05569 [Capronia coronata CBS 617.96]|uniref:Anaphase-promoting complex, subunit CDC26 n=1 Tax=Capronia coronata CBS 617.96 TaxID=1182541 RepID=W9Y7X6_9EURO|nr:uncharacterized protein A1O1_05569 [Capronia coronata CBS 617.96]EXJ88638.1 hypothetical protein A1O1_05569 [Capronia coronata CBS 617.96]